MDAEMPHRVRAVEVFHPIGRESAFATELVRRLRAAGVSSRPVPFGGRLDEMLHVVRKTQPDTDLVVVEYAPRDYHLLHLAAALARWRVSGRRVALCRAEPGALRARQRAALALVRRVADVDLVSTDAGAIFERIGGGAGGDGVRPAAGDGLDAILPLLACPDCRGALRRSGAALACERCEREHEVVDGIPVLLPRDARVQVEEHEEAYVPGDAYRLGAAENRGWLEIGLYKRDLVARMLRSRRPRASIDVGCGDWGLHYDVAGALGSELSIAGDVSLKFVAQARAQATAPGRVHHLVFSAEALPFRDGLFDLVYCSEVLEHLDRPARALDEMRRVAPGARCILTVPNERMAGKLEAGHVQTFGYDDFLALLAGAVEVRAVRGVYLLAEKDPNRLARSRLGPALLAASLRAGERLPRRSLLLVVDGALVPRGGPEPRTAPSGADR